MWNEIKCPPTRMGKRHFYPAPRRFVPQRFRASAGEENVKTIPGVAPHGSCWPVPDGAPPAANPKPMRNGLADPFDFTARALAIWDDEGGASRQDSMHSEYGKRIEADGSWTIYHVFSGAPATIGGELMQGMNSQDALDQMTRTNSDNSTRRAADTGILKKRILGAWWFRLTKYL